MKSISFVLLVFAILCGNNSAEAVPMLDLDMATQRQLTEPMQRNSYFGAESDSASTLISHEHIPTSAVGYPPILPPSHLSDTHIHANANANLDFRTANQNPPILASGTPSPDHNKTPNGKSVVFDILDFIDSIYDNNSPNIAHFYELVEHLHRNNPFISRFLIEEIFAVDIIIKHFFNGVENDGIISELRLKYSDKEDEIYSNLSKAVYQTHKDILENQFEIQALLQIIEREAMPNYQIYVIQVGMCRIKAALHQRSIVLSDNGIAIHFKQSEIIRNAMHHIRAELRRGNQMEFLIEDNLASVYNSINYTNLVTFVFHLYFWNSLDKVHESIFHHTTISVLIFVQGLKDAVDAESEFYVFSLAIHSGTKHLSESFPSTDDPNVSAINKQIDANKPLATNILKRYLNEHSPHYNNQNELVNNIAVNVRTLKRNIDVPLQRSIVDLDAHTPTLHITETIKHFLSTNVGHFRDTTQNIQQYRLTSDLDNLFTELIESIFIQTTETNLQKFLFLAFTYNDRRIAKLRQSTRIEIILTIETLARLHKTIEKIYRISISQYTERDMRLLKYMESGLTHNEWVTSFTQEKLLEKIHQILGDSAHQIGTAHATINTHTPASTIPSGQRSPPTSNQTPSTQDTYDFCLMWAMAMVKMDGYETHIRKTASSDRDLSLIETTMAYPLVNIEMKMYDKCKRRTLVSELRVQIKSDRFVVLVRRPGFLTDARDKSEFDAGRASIQHNISEHSEQTTDLPDILSIYGVYCSNRPVLVDKILAFWKKRNGIRQEFHVFNFQAPTPTEIEIDMYQESSLQE